MEVFDKKIEHLSYSEGASPLLVDFLNEQLRQSSGFSIRDEYPALFNNPPGGESLYVRIHGRIVSHVGTLVREHLHPAYRMRIGLMGSVVTAPEFQNQGLAKACLLQALQSLRKQGAQVAVLWSNNSEFYKGFEFARAGRESNFRFTAQSVPIGAMAQPFDYQKHVHQTWRLYCKHEVRLDRSLEEHKRLVRVPRTKIFVTEKDGQVSSYVAIHKGMDFTNYIHEWAGDPKEVQKNVSWVQKNQFADAELTLIAPSCYPLQAIQKFSKMEWQGVVGLMKILDRKGCLSVYRRYLQSQKVPHQWGDSGTVVIDGSEFSLASEPDCLRLVFGDETTCHPTLPFFLWGFDSI
ncbi:MAG: GNAT family N-acetyltransferase [Deltaproteobacteria bacterium]|nr:GNAT family N-acetyltransferase [Deltaproteobacteria bacterium]